MLLNPLLGIQPQPACSQAWSYLKTNLGASGSSPCAGFPAALVGACPTTATVLTGTLGPYTVKITWPVPDSDPLMANPTVQGGFTQSIDPEVDGDTAADPTVPCSRLGVTVTRMRKSTFAGIFAWAYWKPHARRFDEAARLPLEQD